jgi:hypothetical protein
MITGFNQKLFLKHIERINESTRTVDWFWGSYRTLKIYQKLKVLLQFTPSAALRLLRRCTIG